MYTPLYRVLEFRKPGMKIDVNLVSVENAGETTKAGTEYDLKKQNDRRFKTFNSTRITAVGKCFKTNRTVSH